ncbi:hypothetical protein RND71_030390 [Anisodus tanguticus]|uniref:Uncharacterized protein n=1 Tax=Anisodus tanguticus TaxID=243964 RepID=A0AAE1RI52_9SOLA|nr:hypothetical protein RND71_030390 [Anisodus tanguticus]
MMNTSSLKEFSHFYHYFFKMSSKFQAFNFKICQKKADTFESMWEDIFKQDNDLENDDLERNSIISQKELMETSASSSSPFQRTTGEQYTIDTNTGNVPRRRVFRTTGEPIEKKDTSKIIFCDHCTTMTETVKRFNHTKDLLSLQNTHILEKIKALEQQIRDN